MAADFALGRGLDRQGAIRFLLKGDAKSLVGKIVMGSLVTDWLNEDPMAALRFLGGLRGVDTEFFSALGQSERCAERLRQTVEICLQSNSGELMAFLREGSPVVAGLLCRPIFERLFSTDPVRAVREIDQLPANLRNDAWEWCGEMRKEDAAAVFTMLDEKRAAHCPEEKYAGIFARWLEADPSAARAAAERMPLGPLRDSACLNVVATLAQSDPEAALVWMEAHAPDRTNRCKVYAAIAKKDPERAFDLCNRGRISYSEEVQKWLQNKAAANGQDGLELAAAAANPWMRNEILTGLMEGISLKDGDLMPQLDRLGVLLRDIRTTPGEKTVLSCPFCGISEEQLGVVKAWLVDQPEKVRDALLEPVLSEIPEDDPGAAAAWLAQLPDSVARSNALSLKVSRWASRDVAAAAAFSLNLPPGQDRDYAILNTALAWQRVDPVGARQWVDRLEDSPVRTRAVRELENPSLP